MTTNPDINPSAGLGKRIKELRDLSGLTHAQVGQAAGISRSYVSRLEAGKVALPSREVLKRLAEALGTNREDLLRAAGYLELLPPLLDDPALEIAFRSVENLPPEDRREVLEFVAYVMQRRRRRGSPGETGEAPEG
ncbi:MAG TPA: helix-turn-helix transcriptional regulator [Dehalococcoidia bacterium]|nr:helix-turn-helix transcriptional regulator [Dehalococcoidia bacterium]